MQCNDLKWRSIISLEAKGTEACRFLTSLQLCKALSLTANMSDQITISPLLTGKRNCFTTAIQMFRIPQNIPGIPHLAVITCYSMEYTRCFTVASAPVLQFWCTTHDFLWNDICNSLFILCSRGMAWGIEDEQTSSALPNSHHSCEQPRSWQMSFRGSIHSERI